MRDPDASRPPEERIRNELLRVFLADLDTGTERSDEEYVARHPGHESLVRSELRELRTQRGEAEQETRFGPYLLQRELGRGAQGTVYLATDTRLDRPVALKLLRQQPFGDDESLLRFQREARVASRLEVPGICTVHETGETDGTPYIAMQYVEGETLAARIAGVRADRETMPPLVAIVELFESIARSLHQAHEAGVVHRDLKPGNIMLSEAGQPVLLDFGLARALDESLPTLTRSGDVFGTPVYMAPEQVSGSVGAVDSTTDVYALGVTLHECLTLERPFEAPTREALYHAILTEEPRSPSTIGRGLPADLDLIVRTAMEKDPSRRYRSAAALAEDLRRFRCGEPILARPPSRWYRTRRFASRHRALVAGTAIVVVGLSIATVVTTSALLEARRESFISKRALAVFEEVLTAASRDREGREVRLIDVLDRSAGRLREELALVPEAGARLTGAVGGVYSGLGDYEAAEPLLVDAHSYFREHHGVADDRTIAGAHALGVLRREQARFDEARSLLTDTLERRRRSVGDTHATTLEVALDLAALHFDEGEFARADEIYASIREHVTGDQAIAVLTGLAVLREKQGRDTEGLELQEEAVRRTETLHGPDHVDTAWVWQSLAMLYVDYGRYRDAEVLYRKALEVVRDRFGWESPRVQSLAADLALVLKMQGEYEKAEQLYLGALEGLVAALGPDHPDVFNTQNNLGRLYQAMGRLDDAESRLRQAWEGSARRQPDHEQTFQYRNNLGMVLHDQGRLEEAEEALLEALEGRELWLDPEHPETLKSVNNLAYLNLDLRRFEEAGELFERSLEGRTNRLGEHHPDTIKAMVNLGWFHQGQGRLQEAEAQYARALALCREEEDLLGEILPLPLRLLGQLTLAQGRVEEAGLLARELTERLTENHPERALAQPFLDAVKAAGQ